MVLQPALWKSTPNVIEFRRTNTTLSQSKWTFEIEHGSKGAVVLVDDNGIQTHLPFVLYTESRMSNIPILEWISTPSNGISVAIFLMAISSYKSQKQFNGNSPKSSGESDLQQEANLVYSDSI